ncbi:pyridoxal phosphate-dependent decarboxylase family protein [Saccharothrix longispora]|uniref:Glutamate/tyrosine decarboxylase-like PLP-dependent enzyme n=1 Tax=Saccharothrix longispora TaxID=33920 RepID=A0ABU1PUB6_9PSEU|nr:pyridoxal-dependent decarboxylase [Saccharothrix longispora]MDR6593724.1 glutamate/tyrosine decarboxylase-like PLP-dependent enzyme [Saccharothrix longispora]
MLDDLADLPDLLDTTSRYAASVLTGLPTRPVVRAAPVAPSPLPEAGIGFTGALDLFDRRWAPGFSAAAGPRYLGFVTGGSTPASIAGDWLTSAFDQNPAASDGSSAPDLERETVRWLAALFGLGEEHSGAFVSGATTSNLVGLAVAREWLGEQLGVSVADEGVGALGPVRVHSGAAHSSVSKALSVLGLGRDSLRPVPTLPGREAIDVDRLADELDGTPAIVVANAGTVDTVDFDDLRALVDLRSRKKFWLHVDAAFGGFAALSPRHAHLVDGLAEADSVCVDLHKWLNVPYDSAVQFTRRRDLQLKVFRNAAPYLGQPTDNPDFVHLTPENSRRLRALATWFTLTAYGRDGHRDVVERCTALAHDLGDRIARTPALRLLSPVLLNVVCFTLTHDPTRERVAEAARRIAATGDTFLATTVHKGQPALRAAFSNWRTLPTDVTTVHNALITACTDL